MGRGCLLGEGAYYEECGKSKNMDIKENYCWSNLTLYPSPLPQVLCIDEATASVDQETDGLIQATIRREFAQHTVITIAHRIHTILDNDRVIVMNNGRIAEFDPPGVLLDNPSSLFYGLVHGQT